MKLEWIPTLSATRAFLLDGTVLEFNCKIWSRSKIKDKIILHDSLDEEVNPDLYNCINKYWGMQTQQELLKFEALYIEAYNTLDSELELNELNIELNRIIFNLMSLFDWNRFKLWCIIHGDFNLTVGIKDELGEKDSIEFTYFTKDYEDLVFFSIIMKAIMPIWGMYYNNLNRLVGKEYVLLSALELIRNDYTDSNPAFTKLEQYVNTIASEKIKITGFSITNDIGSEEIPDYLLAFALWKKVCIFDPRVYNDSIIRNIHALLKDRCDRINGGGPNQKNINDEKEAERSIVDTYKIVQRIPPSVEVITSYFIQNNYARYENISPDEFNRVRSLLPPSFDIKEYHTPILAAVCGKEIGGRNIRLIRYEPLIDLITIAHIKLIRWNLLALAELIISNPKQKNFNTMSVNNNKNQNILMSQINAQLHSIYRYAGNQNPGLKLIETIIKEVSGFDYQFQIGEFENIAIEIAQLLILIAQ